MVRGGGHMVELGEEELEAIFQEWERGCEEEVCLHTQGCHSGKLLERPWKIRIWEKARAWACGGGE